MQLWIAQGYIQSSHENECLENVGDHYFEYLLTRSLFQEVEEKHVKQGYYYRMHVLIHDLAQSMEKSNIIILKDDERSIPKNVHHVSLYGATNEVPKDLWASPLEPFLWSLSLTIVILQKNLSQA